MPEPEMSEESIDYARLQGEYGGKHVATLGGEVVASGDTVSEMLRGLEGKGIDSKDVVFRHVRPKGVICVY